MLELALVSMPWQLPDSPSIQVGTLRAALEDAGLSSAAHSFHLALADYLSGSELRARDRLTLEEHRGVANRHAHTLAGEWVFALPPLVPDEAGREEAFCRYLRREGLEPRLVSKLRKLRRLVPAFLEACADEALAGRPRAVGFTVSSLQTMPSLALARLLKERDPGLRILLGGAHCQAPMGQALLRNYPFIDLVVQGEGERVLPELLRQWGAGRARPELPGVVYPTGEAVQETSARVGSVNISENGPPDYDEYFGRLSRSPLAGELRPLIAVESARGCWWGERSHCSFCGLNGRDLKFRSKKPERVLEELRYLARRHEVLDFTMVDNILDHGYFESLLPALAASGWDLRLYYEVRSNLSREQIGLLRAAGVRGIQPGIESLSTPILRLMKKGTTGLKNLQLLKWCALYGVRPDWNLLYGLPGEPPAEYERMADLVPSLVHLDPPRMAPLNLDRFSPYHARPGEHGIGRMRPKGQYALVFGLEETELEDLAYSFDFDRDDGHDARAYASRLSEEVARWRREAPANRGALTYRVGPDFVTVLDRRSSVSPALYTLDELHAAVFTACEESASADQVRKTVRDRLGVAEDRRRVVALLDELVEARLAVEDSGRYLNLALPVSAA